MKSPSSNSGGSLITAAFAALPPSTEQLQEWCWVKLVESPSEGERRMYAAILKALRTPRVIGVLPDGNFALTSAERRVVATVLAHPGHGMDGLALALHVSKHTLRNHLSAIYSKYGIHRRHELAALGLPDACACIACEERGVA